MGSPSRSRLLIEHDLRANAFRVCREGKPLHTFSDHALGRSTILRQPTRRCIPGPGRILPVPAKFVKSAPDDTTDESVACGMRIDAFRASGSCRLLTRRDDLEFPYQAW